MKLASCPPIDQLREFSSGRLADEALETLAEHVDDCPTCRQVLAEASRGADPLLAALREPLTAAPFSEETEYRRAMEVVEALGRSPDTAAGSPTLAARGRAGGPEGAVDSPPL